MPRLILVGSIPKVSVLLRAPILVGIHIQIPPVPPYRVNWKSWRRVVNEVRHVIARARVCQGASRLAS